MRRTFLLLSTILATAYVSALGQTNLPTKRLPTFPHVPPIVRAAGWSTNGPMVFECFQTFYPPVITNSEGRVFHRPEPKNPPTNSVFSHYVPGSLANTLWTNLIAHTNGRTTRVWIRGPYPPDWPTNAPTVSWDTNGLLWGMKGLTALSPCWSSEGSPGQVPVTALTRRHGYARGHGMGPDGFDKHFAGHRVWFLTTDNVLVSRKVLRHVVRTLDGPTQQDYTILLFDQDLPPSIQPMRVASIKDVFAKVPADGYAPWPILMTEQSGHVSADAPGFKLDVVKGGDSGSPNLLPMPGELIFFSGRTTASPSPQMQKDMDELCRAEKLDPENYQLQWVDLSGYPSYTKKPIR
jgi:hypothetical protein